jgi:inorganic triphosphatase YgiF
MEIELKFIVPSSRRKALLRALKSQPCRTQRLQSIYYDTADDRLQVHGQSVRLRKEGRRWVQTAKAATHDLFCRLEHNVNVILPRRQTSPGPNLALIPIYDSATDGRINWIILGNFSIH